MTFRFISLLTLFALLTAGSSAELLDPSDYDRGSVGTTGFEVPQYDSDREVLTRFFTTFGLVFAVLFLGLEKVLQVVMDASGSTKTLRRRALLMSLIITGSLVPTSLFLIIREFVTDLFSIIASSFFFILIIGFLWAVYTMIRDRNKAWYET